MELRFILKQLILPPGGLMLLILLAWLLWVWAGRPRLAVACLVAGLGGLWLLSLPAVVEWAARLIEREPALVEALTRAGTISPEYRNWIDLAPAAP